MNAAKKMIEHTMARAPRERDWHVVDGGETHESDLVVAICGARLEEPQLSVRFTTEKMCSKCRNLLK